MKNDKEHIKALITRHFEGTSSIDEDKELNDYFATSCDGEFGKYKPYFDALANYRQDNAPSNLDDSLRAAISRMESEEKKKARWKRLSSWTAIAASIVIVVTMLAWWQNKSGDPFQNNCDSPEQAAQALMLANDKINHVKSLCQVDMDKVTMQVEKSVEKFNKYVKIK